MTGGKSAGQEAREAHRQRRSGAHPRAGRPGSVAVVLRRLRLLRGAPAAWVAAVVITAGSAIIGLSTPASAIDPIVAKAISDLRAEMDAYDLGTLEAPLESLLDGAARDLEKGDAAAAVDKMSSYVNLVTAHSGKKLPVAVATELAIQATRIVDVLAGPPIAIGWANLQWPPNAVLGPDSPVDIYGQVWVEGVTSEPGPIPGIEAFLGVGAPGTPVTDATWSWLPAHFNTDVGDIDEYVAELGCSHLPGSGEFDYAYRYRAYGSPTYVYADADGPIDSDAMPTNSGHLTAAC